MASKSSKQTVKSKTKPAPKSAPQVAQKKVTTAKGPSPKAAHPAAQTSAQAGMNVNTPKIEEQFSAASTFSLKSYRTNPDMENFFRFIYENDLREEALHIIDEIIAERQAKRKKAPLQA